jgi:hypothetical protein
MGNSRGAYRVLMGKLKEVDYLEHRDIDGRIILKYILEKWDGGLRTGTIWLRIKTGGGLL